MEAGFNEIIKRHQQEIYRIVFSMVGNEAEADEIVQQTFVGALSNHLRM
ncbi:MAG: hypothetical protein HY919_00105 [Elusimicrobia bacterium]|nr:hypothetical protein [Elusimicrobiota bacterium]